MAQGWPTAKIDDCRKRQNSSVQAFSALDAVAVTAEIVVPAERADEAAGWVGLQPAVAITPVPDAVFRTEHPPLSLAVQHREVPHSKPERTRLEAAGTPLRNERLVPGLSFGEGIDGHQDSIAPPAEGPPAGWGVESERTGPR